MMQSGCPDELSIASYLAGVASPATRVGIEAHLAECPDCCHEIAELVRLRATKFPLFLTRESLAFGHGSGRV